MSTWETFSTSYVEAAVASFPLHRAVVALAGFVGCVGMAHQTHPSVFVTAIRMPLKSFLTLDSPQLSDAKLGYILAGVLASIVGLVASRVLLWLVFQLASRATRLWERANAPAHRISQSSLNGERRREEMSLLQAALERPKARLRTKNAVSEILSGLGCISLVAAAWGNWIDLAIGATLLTFALLLTVTSVRYYLSEYLAPSLLIAQLEGRTPPTPNTIE